jgi:hypothetical protein
VAGNEEGDVVFCVACWMAPSDGVKACVGDSAEGDIDRPAEYMPFLEYICYKLWQCQS